MEKQVMQHLKSEMQYQKKSQLTIVTFDSISRKTNGIQPDFILEYAHYLHNYYKNKGYQS
jgi:hypothetical protein